MSKPFSESERQMFTSLGYRPEEWAGEEWSLYERVRLTLGLYGGAGADVDAFRRAMRAELGGVALRCSDEYDALCAMRPANDISRQEALANAVEVLRDSAANEDKLFRMTGKKDCADRAEWLRSIADAIATA